MERDQLREISSNGVLGRIARGVATSTGVVSGANSDLIQQISTSEPDNMDFHPVEINTIPGQRNINANNGEGRKQKTKKSKLLFDGAVMKTLCEELWPSIFRDQVNFYDENMRKHLHLMCKRYMDPKIWGNLAYVAIVKEDPYKEEDDEYPEPKEFIKELESISPFIIPPDDPRWETNSFVENPTPFVMYLFYQFIEWFHYSDREIFVRFTIDVDGTEYTFGDWHENNREYYMKYDGASIRRK